MSGEELLHEYALIRKAQQKAKFFAPLYSCN
jgi:hypothetical protein